MNSSVLSGVSAASRSRVISPEVAKLIEKSLLRFLTENPRANSEYGAQRLLQGTDKETRVKQDWSRAGDYQQVKGHLRITRCYPYITQLVSDFPTVDIIIPGSSLPKGEALDKLDPKARIAAVDHFTAELRVYMAQLEAYFTQTWLDTYDYLFDQEGNIHLFVAEPIKKWLAGYDIADDEIEFFFQQPVFKKHLLTVLHMNLNHYQEDVLRDPALDTSSTITGSLSGADLVTLSPAYEGLILKPFREVDLINFNRAVFEQVIKTIQVQNSLDGSPHPLLAFLTAKLNSWSSKYAAHQATVLDETAENRKEIITTAELTEVKRALMKFGIGEQTSQEFILQNSDLMEETLFGLLKIKDAQQREEKLIQCLRDMFLCIFVMQFMEFYSQNNFTFALDRNLKAFKEERALIGKLNIQKIFELVAKLKQDDRKLEQSLEYQQSLLNLVRLYVESSKKCKGKTEPYLQSRFVVDYLTAQFKEIHSLTDDAVIVRVNNLAANIEGLIAVLNILQVMKLLEHAQFEATKIFLDGLAASAGTLDEAAFTAKINEFKDTYLAIWQQNESLNGAHESAAAIRRFNTVLAHPSFNAEDKKRFFAEMITVLCQEERTLEQKLEDLYPLELDMIATLPEGHRQAELVKLELDRIYAAPFAPMQDKLTGRSKICERVAYPRGIFAETVEAAVKQAIHEHLQSEVLLTDLVDLAELKSQNFTDTQAGIPRLTSTNVTLRSAGLTIARDEYEAQAKQYRYLEGWCEQNHIDDLLKGVVKSIPGFVDLTPVFVRKVEAITSADSAEPMKFIQTFEIDAAIHKSQKYCLNAKVIITGRITATGTQLTAMKVEGPHRALLQYILTTEIMDPKRIKAFSNEGALKPILVLDDILAKMAGLPFFKVEDGAAFLLQLSGLPNTDNDAARNGLVAGWRREVTRKSTVFEFTMRPQLKDMPEPERIATQILLVHALAVVTLQSPLVRGELQRLGHNAQLKEFPQLLSNLMWMLCNWLLAPAAKEMIAIRLQDIFSKLPADHESCKLLVTIIEHLQVIGDADPALVAAIKEFIAGEMDTPQQSAKYFDGLKNIVQILLSKEPQGLELNPPLSPPVLRRSLSEMGSSVLFLTRAQQVESLCAKLADGKAAARRSSVSNGSLADVLANAFGSATRRDSRESAVEFEESKSAASGATPSRQSSAPVAAGAGAIAGGSWQTPPRTQSSQPAASSTSNRLSGVAAGTVAARRLGFGGGSKPTPSPQNALAVQHPFARAFTTTPEHTSHKQAGTPGVLGKSGRLGGAAQIAAHLFKTTPPSAARGDGFSNHDGAVPDQGPVTLPKSPEITAAFERLTNSGAGGRTDLFGKKSPRADTSTSTQSSASDFGSAPAP